MSLSVKALQYSQPLGCSFFHLLFLFMLFSHITVLPFCPVGGGLVGLLLSEKILGVAAELFCLLQRHPVLPAAAVRRPDGVLIFLGVSNDQIVDLLNSLTLHNLAPRLVGYRTRRSLVSVCIIAHITTEVNSMSQ